MSRLELFYEEDHEFTDKIKHFKVVILEFHLHIETGKFAEMPVGVRVLSSKDRSNFEDTLEVGAQCHLLVELGTLGKAGILFEILELENI